MKKTIIKIVLILSIILNSVQPTLAEALYKNDLKQKFQSNNAIIYGLVIRNFNAKDQNCNEIIELEKGEESGTFLNAIERLDELKEMGINTIHLLPVTKTGKSLALGNAGSVYAMASFNEIDPMLDDKNNTLSVKEEAKKFIEECHKRGISVMLDLPACVSYDLYSQMPEIFLKDEKGLPVIPLDWSDVRLLKTIDKKGKLNKKVFKLHKDFADMCLELGVDGIRADVANAKPLELWKNLIKYIRKKDPNFAFVAESSNIWTDPVHKLIKANNYDKLLGQGFDAYYGSYFKFDEWSEASKLNEHVIFNIELSHKYNEPKSVIGSFATHDEPSPITTGGLALSKMIIMLNTTLPMLNPYFISGFETGDTYNYSFRGQLAEVTYTESKNYFVHPNKLDIFNYSRKPEGCYPELKKIIKKANAFRKKYNDLITKGSYIPIETQKPEIISFARSYGDKTLFFIGNRDFKKPVSLDIEVKGLNNAGAVEGFACCYNARFSEDLISAELSPGEAQVFVANNFNLDKYAKKVYFQKFLVKKLSSQTLQNHIPEQ